MVEAHILYIKSDGMHVAIQFVKFIHVHFSCLADRWLGGALLSKIFIV